MTKKQTILLDGTAISRTIARLSHEILERNNNPDNLALIGIQTRGEPLSKRIHSQISEFSGTEIVLGSLDITFHREAPGSISGASSKGHGYPLYHR